MKINNNSNFQYTNNTQTSSKVSFGQTRRDFLKKSFLAGAGLTFMPSLVLNAKPAPQKPVGLEKISPKVIDEINQIALASPKIKNKTLLDNLIKASNIKGLNKNVNPNYIFAYLETTDTDFSLKSINQAAKNLSFLHYKNPKASKAEVLKLLKVDFKTRFSVIKNYQAYERSNGKVLNEVKHYALRYPSIESSFLNDAYLACGKNKTKTSQLMDEIFKQSNNAKVNPNIACALIKHRSGFDSMKKKGNLRGLLLLDRGVYKTGLLDPKINLKKGLKTFSIYLNKYGNYKDAIYSFILGEKNYLAKKYSTAEAKKIDAILSELRESKNSVYKEVITVVKQKRIAKQSKKSNSKKLIVIDAGHGGKDSGALGHKALNGVNEDDITLRIAKNLKKLLKKDFKVIMTRENNTYKTLGQRTRLANNKKADLFVSIHCNGNEKPHIKGAETLAMSPQSLNIAEFVQRELIKATKFADRKAHAPFKSLFVLNQTNCRAILVEAGYITNKTEGTKLNSSVVQNKIAQAIYDGIKKASHLF